MHRLDDDPCITTTPLESAFAIDGEVEECECPDSLLSASERFDFGTSLASSGFR